MSCRCEPHASGSNRCEECRRELRQDGCLASAVEFIRSLAFSSNNRAAEWLDRNGFDGPLKARRELERRKAELDEQIVKLQEERARLTGEGSPCG